MNEYDFPIEYIGHQLTDIGVSLGLERIIAGEKMPDTDRYVPSKYSLDEFHLMTFDGYIAGTMGFIEFYISATALGEEFFIAGVSVEPDYRRMGVAQALLNESELLAAKNDCDYLQAQIDPSNGPSIGLFESMGYDIFQERNQAMLTAMKDVIIPAKVYHLQSEDSSILSQTA